LQPVIKKIINCRISGFSKEILRYVPTELPLV